MSFLISCPLRVAPRRAEPNRDDPCSYAFRLVGEGNSAYEHSSISMV